MVLFSTWAMGLTMTVLKIAALPTASGTFTLMTLQPLEVSDC